VSFPSVQRSRGRAGLDTAGFLALFAGIAVHDCWVSYWCFDDVTHALCDQHLLRELVALRKYFRGCRGWALRMSTLLLVMRDTRDEYEAAGHARLPANVRDALTWLYLRVLDEAVAEIPPPPEREPGRRGRPKRGKALSLVDRMRAHMDEFLLFLDDFRVPFTNNLAERAFRLVGAKKHVSGCFRTLDGAEAFVTIWSYLSTARKHGHSYWEAALEASRGHAMELVFPDGVEAAIEELRRESGGLPLKPAEDKKAAKDKKPEGAAA
jgi:transposase